MSGAELVDVDDVVDDVDVDVDVDVCDVVDEGALGDASTLPASNAPSSTTFAASRANIANRPFN